MTPTISCGVCGACDAEPLWTASGLGAAGRRYAFVRSTACGVARTDPQRRSPCGASDTMPTTAGGTVTRLVGPVERMRRALARGRARRLARGLAPRARVLDVGCGDGKLAVALLAAGVRAVGLAASTLDAVVVWHVLEYLPEPPRALAEAARCLRPGGILVVAVPDAAGLAARLGRGAWLGLDVERHLYHFAARTLGDVLAAEGFVVRRRRHLNVELAVIDVLDTVLRRLGLGRFALYQYLATGARRSGTAIVGFALATLALPFAFVGALGAGAVGRGTDVQVWAERRAAPRDA